MTEATLYNIATTLNSQDRLLYDDTETRDLDFAGLASITRRVSTFQRIDDLTFKIELYLDVADTYADIIGKYNYIKYQGYYGFISSMIEKTNNTQVTLTISLDTITTYMTKDNIDVNKEVFVKRTHLDRFIETAPGLYRYNFANSDLLIREEFNIEPSIIDETITRLFKEFGNEIDTKLVWLAITKTETGGDVIPLVSKAGTTTTTLNFATSNKTYYYPLVSSDLEFRNSSNVLLGTATLSAIMANINTTDIIDIKVIPYLAVETEWRFYRVGTQSVLEVPSSTYVVELASGLPATVMFSNVRHGDVALLDLGSPLYDHKPIYDLATIQAQNKEPKLLQFRKYILSFFQGTANIFFDMCLNEDITLKVQRGANYGTERNDFYLETGYYDNAKNTGGILSIITDNTLSTVVNQFAEYTIQKKVTSSAGYAYGGAIAGTVLGLGLTGLGAVATGGLSLATGVAGAGQIGSGITNVLQTYAQREDLKQAPNSVKSRGGNIINDIKTEDAFGATITIATPLTSEEDIIESYLYHNGYKYGKVDNLLNLIDTRIVFNFIQTLTSDKVLNIGVSDAIMNDINDRLNNGVRFYKALAHLTNKPKINNERSL